MITTCPTITPMACQPPKRGIRGHLLAAKAEQVRHAGAYLGHIAGGDEPLALSATISFAPCSTRRSIAAPAQVNQAQPNHKDGNLHVSDHRAAIQAEQVGFGADQKEDESSGLSGRDRNGCGSFHLIS